MMNVEMMKNAIDYFTGFLAPFKGVTVNWQRFNYCQAWVSEPLQYNNIMIRLVKSYNTIVGFINLNTCEYIELGKWSRTTSKQVTQIHNAMFRSFERKFIDIAAN